MGVLNWGLGHATRMIPLIKALQKQKVEVIIGGDGASLLFMKKEFPDIEFLDLEPYNVQYHEKGSLEWVVMQQFPRLMKVVKKENKDLDSLIQEHDLDAVISDNRYGLWSHKIPSILITHQVFIKTDPRWRIFNSVINKLHHKYINKFYQCWIPDYENAPSLSGELSHNKEIDQAKFKYIGPLSRLEKKDLEIKNDLMILLSGPEPHRGIFEEQLLEQLDEIDDRVLLAAGKVDEWQASWAKANLRYYNFLDSAEVEREMNASRLILCRSGYSSIMDLARLNKNAILVPTPGQGEQLYLAKHFKEQKIFYSTEQKNFNLKEALEKSKDYPGINFSSFNKEKERLELRIKDFLNSMFNNDPNLTYLES